MHLIKKFIQQLINLNSEGDQLLQFQIDLLSFERFVLISFSSSRFNFARREVQIAGVRNISSIMRGASPAALAFAPHGRSFALIASLFPPSCCMRLMN
jgi:hypothetical protein